MKKRTDRKIAIGGSLAAAVLLPAVMVGLAQAGAGVPEERSEARGCAEPVPSFGPPTKAPGASPSPKLPKVPPGTKPFRTGDRAPSPDDPGTNPGGRGTRPGPSGGGAPGTYAKAADGAAITSVRKSGTRQFDVTIASPALGAKVETRVLVPRGWTAAGGRSLRAAMGLSSGGQGAITYAERHPGLFRYAACYSGSLNITAPGMPAILTSMNREAGTAIWGDPIIARANWREHDAAAMVARLKGTGVYVSSGDGRPGPFDDPDTVPWHAGRIGEQLAGVMTANFVESARRAGVPVTANLYGPGMHNWKYWRRELERSWPALAAAIGARKS
ncbi:alpha/beta hydrolase [Actinomadura sp. 3N508]|uniref:alpha/beta hydrolase n=1 Tax=Actinomadura sp. 3N508 TaxID=3375153 RepID=UPI00378827BF